MTELHPFSGPRGLRGYTQFKTSYGQIVDLQASSAVVTVGRSGAVVESTPVETPQYVWLRIRRPPELPCSAHLSKDNARELMLALAEFLDEDPQDEEEDYEDD